MTSDDHSGATFSHQYTWDAEGRQLTATTLGVDVTSYTYDGDGRRVMKSNSSSTTLYWYGAGGNVLSETTGTGELVHDYIYFAGGRLAMTMGGAVLYYRGDPIGSARQVASSIGTPWNESDFTPFGSEIVHMVNSAQDFKFAGMERDAETGNDHTQNRQYASNFGRWLSPDPAGKKAVTLTDPQTWNMYAYVRDLPTVRADPTGLCSSPKVGKGQVGICVDLYIQAKRIKVVGLGDNRGPTAKDPKGRYRVELQMIADPKKGTVRIVKDDAGVSKVLGGLLQNKGTDTTAPIRVVTDDKGTMHFTVNNTALNGLSFLPRAPKDTIKTRIAMDVTQGGKVGVEGGLRTAYPSLEIYRYDEVGRSTPILQIQETNPGDLARQDQVIPVVEPQ